MRRNQTKRMNFLLFMPETVRADFVFGEEGLKAQTPVMDRMAAEGVSFTNFFSVSPFCTPSRCSMFTGRYPHVDGHRALMHLLHAYERNLFMDLREAGYETVCFGKNDLVAGEAIGKSFDETSLRVRPEYSDWRPPSRDEDDKHYNSFYIGERDQSAAHDFDWACIESALDFLGSRHDKPFCLFLPLHFAHPSYVVEEPYFSLHDRTSVKKPIPARCHSKTPVHQQYYNVRNLEKLTADDYAEIRATYQGMISRVDAQLGLLLRKLDDCGLADNTTVLMFSDHGDYAGDYGEVEKINHNFDDCLLHIPLIVRVPGCRSGLIRECMVEGVDLYPTLMELAGIEPQHQHFGRSFHGLLETGVQIELRDCIFAEAGFSKDEYQSYTPLDHVVGSPYERTVRLLDSRRGIPGRRVMMRTRDWKYVYSPGGYEELYNLETDPDETRNLAGCGYDGIESEMKERILRWMVETSDCVPFTRDSREFQ